MHPKRIAWLMIALPAFALLAAPSPLRAEGPAGFERVTIDIELEACGKTLRRVARLFTAGFTRSDADRLAREIDALPTDKSAQWTYQVTYGGDTTALTVHALVDELSMVDLDFVTTPAIAARLRKALGDVEH